MILFLLIFRDISIQDYFRPNMEKWTYLLGFILKSSSSKDAFLNVESKLLYTLASLSNNPKLLFSLLSLLVKEFTLDKVLFMLFSKLSKSMLLNFEVVASRFWQMLLVLVSIGDISLLSILLILPVVTFKSSVMISIFCKELLIEGFEVILFKFVNNESNLGMTAYICGTISDAVDIKSFESIPTIVSPTSI